jgi:cytochrome c oxidase assembly protein subunit 15
MTDLKANNNFDKPIFIWLLSGCFLVFLMVVIGGITRLTGSGLSITEWKVIMGTLPPLNETEWLEAFEKYKQIPQFKLINHYFSLSDFKFIFFWEWFHRLIGRVIGLVFIIPFLYFWIKGRINKNLLPKLIIIFLLGGLQGFLGWFMVSSGLSQLTYVSHFRLAAHLITAFATFGFIFWIALDVNKQRQNNIVEQKKNIRLWRWFFSLLILQIIYGAFVAGLHAGFEINTWPLMNGKLFFTDSFSDNGLLYNLLNNKSGVQIVHRYLAYAVVVSTILFALKLKKYHLNLVKASNILVIAVSFQFILGILTILFINIDTWKVTLGVLHQSGAFILFASYIYALHKIRLIEN